MPPIELASYLFSLIGLSLIILLVAVKNYRTKTNRWFILFASFVLLYTMASFASELITDLDVALIWTRTALCAAAFIPLCFYFFTLAFTGHKPKYKWLNSLFVSGTLVLAAVAYLPANITSIERHRFGTTIGKTGPLLWLTLIYYVAIFVVSFRILLAKAKVSDQSVRLQVQVIIYGIGSAVVINLITQIALPEIHIVVLGNLVGTPSLVLLVGAVGYAILRQHLFDIRAVIIRSFGYLLTIGSAAVVYGLVLLVVSKLLFPGLRLSFAQNIYFVGMAVVLALSFRTIVRAIAKFTDKIFYSDRYDPEELVNQIGRVLSSEIELAKLSSQVRDLLAKHLRAKQIDLVVLDKGLIFYESAAIFTSVLTAFTQDLQSLGGGTLVTDDLAEDKNKAILRKYGISVFTPLETRNEKVGYLLLAEKSSGSLYDSNDIRVINIVADELAIAIQNSRAYTQIQEFNHTLQIEIEAATLQLRAANEKLKESDAVKDDFISMASHQLSTPLAAIDGYLDLAVKGIYGPLGDKLTHPLTAALDRAQLMKSMVVDLLNISRMTAGKFFLELAPANIDELVLTEVGQLQYQAKSNKILLKYHPPAQVLPVMNLDDKKIRQTVMNLVLNALQYTKDEVNVYLDSNGTEAIFKVVDNGIGVPEGQKAKLFTKFFRADNAKKERPSGTGIGLYMVKRIVEDHGGKTIFESEAGKGSTFGFSLPLKPNKQLPTIPKVQPPNG